MPRDFPIPTTPESAAHIAAWVDAPGEGAPVKPAATVMLVRDGACGVEVFMQRRVASMAFAPRRAVFPGGSVDPGDHEVLPWHGPEPAVWAKALRLPEGEAVAVIAAGIRELFEEAGVLLASERPAGDDLTSASTTYVTADRLHPVSSHLTSASRGYEAPRVDAWRGELERREVTLAGLLRREGLVARADLLGYHARWITPAIEPRRYDTHFFTALLPAGQQADDRTTEAESADWVVPQAILAEPGNRLMPPTIACLDDLAAASSAAEFVCLCQDAPVIAPVPVRHGDGWAMRAVEL